MKVTMIKRHILALTLAPVFALSLVACGNKESPKSEPVKRQVSASSQPVQLEPPKPLSKQELNVLVSKVMKDNFMARSGNCWLAKNSYNNNYCLKVKSVNSVLNAEGYPETIYILAMGDAVNTDEAAHAEGGMTAMFVVRPESGGGYLMIAKKGPFEDGGGWGTGGEGKFVSLGKGQYGWKIVTSFFNQGITEECTAIYTLRDAQIVELSRKLKTY